MARDGADDHLPTSKPQLDNPLANHVVIKLAETGTYIIIAHLMKSSIEVKQGDQLKAGLRIASCGNSGHSSEPNVHIHHQRQHPAKLLVEFC